MPEGIFQSFGQKLVEAIGNGVFPEYTDLENAFRFVELDFAFIAVKAHFAPHFFGERDHFEMGGNPVFEHHAYTLVIHNIIVAGVNALAVFAAFVSLAQLFFGIRHILADDVVNPAVCGAAVFFPIFHVNALGAVRARKFIFTILATVGGAFGAIFRLEARQPARRINAFAPRADIILQQIQIVAAFLQNHRRSLGVVAPISAHEAVCVVPIRHLFGALNRNEIAYRARIQNFLYFQKRGRVSQYVTDKYLSAAAFPRVEKLVQFFPDGRNRLFEQNNIIELQGAFAHTHMVAILRGYQENIAALFLEKFPFVRKRIFGFYVPFRGETFNSFGRDIAQRSYLKFILLSVYHTAVRHRAARTAPDNRYGKNFISHCRYL